MREKPNAPGTAGEVEQNAKAQHAKTKIRCNCGNVLTYVKCHESEEGDRELLKDEIQELAEDREPLNVTAYDYQVIEKTTLPYMYCTNKGCGTHGFAAIPEDSDEPEIDRFIRLGQ